MWLLFLWKRRCSGFLGSAWQLSPDWAIQIRALAGDIVLCSWARHSTLTVPLSTQVYKWVLADCCRNLTKWGGVTCDGLASCPGGVEILLAASCYKNQDKLRQHEPVSSKASHIPLKLTSRCNTGNCHIQTINKYCTEPVYSHVFPNSQKFLKWSSTQ